MSMPRVRSLSNIAWRTKPSAKRTAAIPTAKASVRRSRSGILRMVLIVPEPIAESPDRLQRAASKGAVDLLAQIPDVDVDNVRIALVGHVPRVLDQHLPRQHDARPAHEQVQQRELLRRQGDR